MIISNNHRFKITIGKITKKNNKLFVILLVNIYIYNYNKFRCLKIQTN